MHSNNLKVCALSVDRTRKGIFFGLVILALALLAFLFFFRDFVAANLLWVALGLVLLFVFLRFEVIVFLHDYERAVVSRFGRVNRVGGPGWMLMIPGIESYDKVDLRVQVIDIPKQDVITRDNIEVKVDAVIYLRVKKDPGSVIKSVLEVKDLSRATELYVIAAIRNILASFSLQEVNRHRDDLNSRLLEGLKQISESWGVQIVSAEIKDIDIPRTVIEAMHEENAAISRKLATLQKAEGHRAEIDAVREAAEQLSDKALAYYYIKALERMGEGASTKFVLPMELTSLATSLSRMTKPEPAQPAAVDMEELFRKYAPAFQAFVQSSGSPEKKKPAKTAER
ncbi:MAG: hypothetical protein HY917_02965 [Candidatus Diapherotrites archaeon]|nr:hypothetical protein [Candidatus Diapherotrites archaeon]